MTFETDNALPLARTRNAGTIPRITTEAQLAHEAMMSAARTLLAIPDDPQQRITPIFKPCLRAVLSGPPRRYQPLSQALNCEAHRLFGASLQR